MLILNQYYFSTYIIKIGGLELLYFNTSTRRNIIRFSLSILVHRLLLFKAYILTF